MSENRKIKIEENEIINTGLTDTKLIPLIARQKYSIKAAPNEHKKLDNINSDLANLNKELNEVEGVLRKLVKALADSGKSKKDIELDADVIESRTLKEKVESKINNLTKSKEKLISTINAKTETYVEPLMGSLYKQYSAYFDWTELPKKYYDRLILPIYDDMYKQDVGEFFEDIDFCLEVEFNAGFCLASDVDTEIMAAYIIQEYFKQAILYDRPLKHILYLNAPLYVNDCKRLIGYNTNPYTAKRLSYNIETISDRVFTSDLVIWDNYKFSETSFEENEVYLTFSARHKSGLSNIVLTGEGVAGLRETSKRLFVLFKQCGLRMLQCTKGVKKDNKNSKSSVKGKE